MSLLVKERISTDRRSVTCDCCKNPIYYENEEYEQDPCYRLDNEMILCEDCFESYAKERFFMILQ